MVVDKNHLQLSFCIYHYSYGICKRLRDAVTYSIYLVIILLRISCPCLG